MKKPRYELHDLARAMMAAGLEWETDETAESATRRVLAEVRRRIRAVKLSTRECSPLIDLLYEPSERCDRNQAARRIVLRELFEALHPGAVLLTYDEREAAKTEGWRRVSDTGLSVSERVAAAEQVIAAHYARSAWSSLRDFEPLSFLRHPGLPEYKRHYLHADPEHTRELFGGDVADVLLHRHQNPVRRRIGRGRSYWDSANTEGARP